MGAPARQLAAAVGALVLYATKVWPMLVVLVSLAQPCPWQEECHGLVLRELALALVLSSGKNFIHPRNGEWAPHYSLAVSCRVQPRFIPISRLHSKEKAVRI